MKQSSILLATLFKLKTLEKSCISNYRYIAYKNNIDYNYKENYTIKDLFDNKHESILCMNHFSIFIEHRVNVLLNKLCDNIKIILPNFLNSPIELIPCYIKNCDWSQTFINLYTDSKLHNLQQFIEEYDHKDSEHILYTDKIQISHNNNNPGLIKSYIGLNHKEALNQISKENLNLGIL